MYDDIFALLDEDTATTQQRKLDTRRKVIPGGALLDLAERDSGASAMLDRLVRNLAREQDRKAFADYNGRFCCII